MCGETILIVGPGDGATAAGAALDGAPYRVLREAEGAPALEVLGREPVQLVVAEWDMPASTACSCAGPRVRIRGWPPRSSSSSGRGPEACSRWWKHSKRGSNA